MVLMDPNVTLNSNPSTQNGIGIIVLSTHLKVLYLNSKAREIGPSLIHPIPGGTAYDSLPKPLQSLFAEITKVLKVRIISKQWSPFEIQQTVDIGSLPYAIQAFGLPNTDGWEQSRIIILIRSAKNGNQEPSHWVRYQETDSPEGHPSPLPVDTDPGKQGRT